MFDEETRRGAQGSLQAFGDAFAGRGIDINYAIQDLNPFLDEAGAGPSQPGEPADRPARLLQRARAQRRRVRAGRREQAELFRNLDITFGAFARVAYPYIQESISEGPETLDVATESLPKLRTLLDNSAELFTAFQPGINALANAAPDLAELVEQGTPVLEGRAGLQPAHRHR